MSISQSYKSEFFSGKKPWSLIKDEILKKYLPPYLKKVNTLNRGIIIVDGFAGPGIFDDGTIGSPMIIYDIVKSIGEGNILVNKELKHHLKLNVLIDNNANPFDENWDAYFYRRNWFGRKASMVTN
jgi:three-Cys-motif partner protein